MGKHGFGKVFKICEFCKKEFYARRDRMGKFCSKSCSSSLKPKRYLRIFRKCIICDISYEIKLYRKNISLYCSNGCRRRGMPKKEMHSNWKGGFSRTWKSRGVIKKLIKLKNKCEKCFSTKNLQGHHIIHYSKDKTLREDENNIQILCIYCHAKEHPNISKFILKGEVHA